MELDKLKEQFKGLLSWQQWEYFEWVVLFMHEIGDPAYHLETTQLWIDGHMDRRKRFDDDKIDRGKR